MLRIRLKDLSTAFIALFLTACTFSKQCADGPPLPWEDRDVRKIPNAVPKKEPRSRSGNAPTYTVKGKCYTVLPHSHGYVAEGTASWYGRLFHGRCTSSGEPYDMFGMTAAHRSLPLPTYARVTNLHNGREVIVKINDRGPFVSHRILDLSYAAAKKLGFHQQGVAKVRIKALTSPTPLCPPPGGSLYVQLGCFRNKGNAERLMKQAKPLMTPGDKARVSIREKTVARQTRYQVRIGPFATKAEAQKRKCRLQAGLSISSLFVYDEKNVLK